MAEHGHAGSPGIVAPERVGDSREGPLPLIAAGPVLYGILFIAALPILLVAWAHGAADAVMIRPLRAPLAGALVFLAGAALWLAGVRDLVVRGHGLPMNAYPPAELVESGVYGWIAHPIYIGAFAAAAGVAVWAGSASALWLILPVLGLSMAALVIGLESPALVRRFGRLPRTRIAIPAPGDTRPIRLERISVFLLVLLPWLVLWSAVQQIGPMADAFSLETAREAAWPVIEWTAFVYASCYILVPLAPILAPTRTSLRRFAIVGLIATAAITTIWLLLPVVSPERPFTPRGLAGRLLALDRASSSGVAAFPAFHVVWAMIAADTLAVRSRRWSIVAWLWAAAIAVSCITTGMHTIADVAAAVLVYPPLRGYRAVWEAMRQGSERLANSWREWHFGPVRVIVHGAWAALAGGIAWFGMAALTPGQPRIGVAAVAVGGLLGAGIWAQAIESSSGLLRPFGYYGAVLGTLIAAPVAALFGGSPLLVLGALAVAAPWTQAAGRVRCLVQGCCHGDLAPEAIGIRYSHPRSRVSYLAHLAGRPLHPTPLYSILSNIVLGLALMRLWTLGAHPLMLIGIFHIGNGLARFVEESRRGEPQTPVLGGLRLYEWLAIASVVGGAAATAFAGPPAPYPAAVVDGGVIAGTIAFGLLTGFAMGVDFPRSDRRFSRLAT